MARKDRSVVGCGEYRERIYPMLLQTISERERDEVLAHTAECAGCRFAVDILHARLESITDDVTPKPEVKPVRSRSRRRFWFAVLTLVPIAIAYGLLIQQGIKVGRYRYEQRFVARLEKALYLYGEDFGKFPPADGVPLSVYLGTDEGRGPYMDLAKERLNSGGNFEDYWGNVYVYSYPGVRNQRLWDIHSNGQNGKDDGGRGDDVTNWEDGWETIPPR